MDERRRARRGHFTRYGAGGLRSQVPSGTQSPPGPQGSVQWYPETQPLSSEQAVGGGTGWHDAATAQVRGAAQGSAQ
jgi:hypothetical protein